MAASIVGYRLWDQDTTVMPAALADCSAALAAAHASVSRSGAARLASILARPTVSHVVRTVAAPTWQTPCVAERRLAIVVQGNS